MSVHQWSLVCVTALTMWHWSVISTTSHVALNCFCVAVVMSTIMPFCHRSAPVLETHRSAGAHSLTPHCAVVHREHLQKPPYNSQRRHLNWLYGTHKTAQLASLIILTTIFPSRKKSSHSIYVLGMAMEEHLLPISYMGNWVYPIPIFFNRVVIFSCWWIS